MRVSIIGTGYVGLVTGACLAEKGHEILCVDVDRTKVDMINQGIAPIHESGLNELLRKNLKISLKATTDLAESVLQTDISMIAVGTPFDGAEIDLTFVRKAAQQIGAALRCKNSYHLVVVKSTVVPGTTDEVVRPVLEEASGKRADADFGVGMNPEFLTEGQAVQDFMFPDRFVFGGQDDKSRGLLERLYSSFVGVPIIRTNNKTAETIKYTANCLLATMISFSNEIGNLCASLGGIDVVEVMEGVHSSNYLSWPQPNGTRLKAPITSFLAAGCGYGGSCLPKDIKALMAHGKRAGRPMPLLEAVNQINELQPHEVLCLLNKHFNSLEGVEVAVLGLAFRPDTSDMRESPAIPLIREMQARKARIRAYDPVTKDEAQRLFGNNGVWLCDTLAEAVNGVQAIVLVTRWEEFRRLPELLKPIEPAPLFVDGRRMLDKRDFARYAGIGL